MSNLVSTLTLQLNDDGLAAKARADAEALKKLGATEADLRKLGRSGADALARLHDLGGKGARLDAFRTGARNLKELGAEMRQTRAAAGLAATELDRVRAAAAKATPGRLNTKEIRAAENAHKGAMKRADQAAEAWREQASAHRSLRKELVAAGVGFGARGANGGRGLAIGKAEVEHRAGIEAANRALREQIDLLRQREAAERQHAAQAPARAAAARAALRGAVDAGLEARASREAVQREHVRKRASASRDMTAGMGRAGARELDAVEARNADARARRRMADGMGQRPTAELPHPAPSHARRGYRHEEADERRRERWQHHHGVVGATAGAAAGYASAHGVMGGIEHSLKAGAQYQHEAVALRNAGRTRAEMGEINEASRATTRLVPTAGYAENLKVVNETTGAFGSLDHAIEHLTFMQKAAAVVKNAAGDKVQDDAGEMGNKMARFAEERGTAGDGHLFEHEAEKLVRAMVFTRGNFNASEALNFAQQAKSSLQGYNERFLTGIMPSIVTTMGGDRAGTAANSFNSVIDGKVNDRKQAEEWMRLGLLDKDQAIMKAGHAVGWRTGAIKDTAGAHADPLKWMEEVVLPALRTKGGRDGKGINVDDQEELKSALATMFRNQNANFFANELAQLKMRTRLHKDEHLMKQTGTLDEMHKRNLNQDPYQSFTALRTSIENLTAAMTSPTMTAAASGMSGAAQIINDLANIAQQNPVSATMGGAAVAGGALAGAGYLSYQLINGFGLGTSATALSASAASLEGAAIALRTGAAAGAAGPGAAATTGAAAAAGGTAAFLGVISVAVGTAVAAAFAIETARKQLPKEMERQGPGAFDPATGGLAEDNPMAGLGPKTPVVTEWFQKRWPGLFGNAKGSLPPGDAYTKASRHAAPTPLGTLAPNTPAPVAPVRLPGLDGRPGGFSDRHAPPVYPPKRPEEFQGKTYQPGFGEIGPSVDGIKAAQAALAEYRHELANVKSEMATWADIGLPSTGGMEQRKAELERLVSETEAKLIALGSMTIAPRVDSSQLDGVRPTADGARSAIEGLNVSVAPKVDTGSIAQAHAVAQSLLGVLQQIGSTAGGLPGRISAATAGTNMLQGRSLIPRARSSSPSFSDGVTPGAGAG